MVGFKYGDPMHPFPDHPDIDRALRSGYPFGEETEESVYCGECGRCLDGEKQYSDEHYEYLCVDCLCDMHER